MSGFRTIWRTVALLASLASLAAFEPAASYKGQTVDGFRILVSAECLKHAAETQAALDELQHQVNRIRAALPAPLLQRLQQVPIWLEWQAKTNGAAEYHPSKQWLKDNGYNPAKAKAIEISNIRNFVRWSKSDQPSMLLHELAHAFHDQVLGWDDPQIKAAFDEAVDSNRYQAVRHVNGATVGAYALRDAKEYFAEVSEAYFGRNDFYPFTREELKIFDPAAHQLMDKKWAVHPPAVCEPSEE